MSVRRPAGPGPLLCRSRLLALAGVAGLASACGGDPADPARPAPPPSGAFVPARIVTADSALEVAVEGRGFTAATRVVAADGGRATAFESATRLRVTLLPADRAGAGTNTFRLVTPPPGGGEAALALDVEHPAPTATVAASAALVAAQGAATVTLVGAGFRAGVTTVLAGDSARPSTVVSASELRVDLTAADLAGDAPALLQVVNPAPGGGTTRLTLPRLNPAPAEIVLEVAHATAGQPGMEARVRGRWFPPDVQAFVRGAPRAVARDSATLLRVALTAGDVSAAVPVPIRIVAPPPGGGSADLTLPVLNPVPRLGPGPLTVFVAGTASGTLVVEGAGLNASSVIHLDGHPRRTTPATDAGGAVSLYTTLTAADLATPGARAVTVVNPAPGGGTSNALTLEVRGMPPSVLSLPSYAATAGSAGFDLVVDGYDFFPTTTASLDGVPLAVTYVSQSRLRVAVPAAALARAGTPRLRLANNGGADAYETWYPIAPRPAGGLEVLATVPLPARDLVYSVGQARLFASVEATAPRLGGCVVAMELEYGRITDSLCTAAPAGALALDGAESTLWVAYDAAGAVRRVVLAPRLAFGAESVAIGDAAVADLAEGASLGSLLVARRTADVSATPIDVMLYAGETLRGRAAVPARRLLPRLYNGSVLALGGGDLTVLQHSSRGIDPIRRWGGVPAAGAAAFAFGRLYLGSGDVYDLSPAAGGGDALPPHVGRVVAGGARPGRSLDVDVNLGRLFVAGADGTLRAFDLNTLEPLGAVVLPPLGAESGPDTEPRFRLLRIRGTVGRIWSSGMVVSDGRHVVLFRTGLAGF